MIKSRNPIPAVCIRIQAGLQLKSGSLKKMRNASGKLRFRVAIGQRVGLLPGPVKRS